MKCYSVTFQGLGYLSCAHQGEESPVAAKAYNAATGSSASHLSTVVGAASRHYLATTFCGSTDLRYLRDARAASSTTSYPQVRLKRISTAVFLRVNSVAYASFGADRASGELVIDWARLHNERRHSPNRRTRTPACTAGTDADSAWRRLRPSSGRVGAPPGASRRAGVLRRTGQGSQEEALLISQEAAS